MDKGVGKDGEDGSRYPPQALHEGRLDLPPPEELLTGANDPTDPEGQLPARAETAEGVDGRDLLVASRQETAGQTVAEAEEAVEEARCQKAHHDFPPPGAQPSGGR